MEPTQEQKECEENGGTWMTGADGVEMCEHPTDTAAPTEESSEEVA